MLLLLVTSYLVVLQCGLIEIRRGMIEETDYTNQVVIFAASMHLL